MTSVSPVTRRLTPVKGLLLRWFACFYEGPIAVRTLIVTRRSLEFLSTRGSFPLSHDAFAEEPGLFMVLSY